MEAKREIGENKVMITSFPLITGYEKRSFIHVPVSFIHNQIALSDFKEIKEIFKSGITHVRIQEK